MKALALEANRERGFALLLVLLVLVLSVSALASLGRASVERALLAREQTAALRAKWAEISARWVLAQSGPRILHSRLAAKARAARGEDPLPGDESIAHDLSRLRGEVELLGVSVHAVFDDECAKIPLGAFYEERGKEGLARYLEGELSSDVAVRISPYERSPNPEEAPVWPGPFSRLEQVFSSLPAPLSPRGDASADSVRRRYTVQSGGKVRLQTAPESVLEEMFQERVESDDIAERIIELRRTEPALLLEDALRFVPMSFADRRVLRSALTDRSDTYSVALWVNAGAKTSVSLAILSGEDSRGRSGLFFRW